MNNRASVKVVNMALATMATLLPPPAVAQQADPIIRQSAPVASGRSAPAPAPKPVAKVDDATGTAAANADAAAKADAQTRKIIGAKEAYKASVAKSVADYDAKMEAYREQVRANEAKNAEIRRRNEARAALYKACVAGDKAACQRYNGGQ